MKKLVIFDLDGTLLYTLEDIRKSLNFVLEKHGYRAVSLEKTETLVGNGAKNLIASASGESGEKLDELFLELSAVMKSCDNALTVLYAGLDGELLKLKNAGFKLAIVSNKPDGAVQEIYKQKLSKFGFDYVAGANPSLYAVKPDKACVEYCLNALGVQKQDAVYVGDSEVDAKTAKNAGIDCVSVLWGYRRKEQILGGGGYNFISEPSELYDAVMKLN